MADTTAMESTREDASAMRRFIGVAYRPRVLAVVSLLVGALIAAPHVRRLSRQLVRQPLYLISLDNVRISKPHPWVPSELFAKAVTDSGLVEPLSAADPELIPKLKQAIEASPWVERVEAMQVDLRTGLAIHIRYRLPALTVQTAKGLYPVDAAGVVLPPHDFRAGDADRIPMLQVLDVADPPEAGHRWRDDTVVAAARLASQLDSLTESDTVWQRCQFRSIAPAAVDSSVFEIQTAGRSRVIWGRVDSADVEPAPEKKIGKLEQILAERGSLSAPAGPYLIDLRRWDVVTLEPLATSTR